MERLRKQPLTIFAKVSILDVSQNFEYAIILWGEWLSGLRRYIRNWKVQTPLGARLGFGIQPRYEAPGDLQVEIINAVVNIGLVRLPPRHWSKVGRGAAKQQIKQISNWSKNILVVQCVFLNVFSKCLEMIISAVPKISTSNVQVAKLQCLQQFVDTQLFVNNGKKFLLFKFLIKNYGTISKRYFDCCLIDELTISSKLLI